MEDFEKKWRGDFGSTWKNIHPCNSDIPSFQVRPQAAGIRRSVQAHPEEEGQDHQEAGPQAGVHRVQVEEPGEHSIA